MKKLLIGTAIVAVLSSAAFAQSYNPSYGTGNIAPVVGSLANGYPAYGSRETAYGAYAQAPRDVRAGMERNGNEPYQPYGVSGGRGWFSQDGW
jgi:hypothetical protein